LCRISPPRPRLSINAAHEIVTVVAAGTTVAITAADAAAMHKLATILDEYNNGKSKPPSVRGLRVRAPHGSPCGVTACRPYP